MPTSEDGSGRMAYRPTSLDFINRPNPVEPHAGPEKHPLNGPSRLDNSSNQDLLRLLLDKNGERSSKRRKSGDAKSLDLPKLPAVRNNAKRLRIPPTLSGLHQPPPDAGLLPSMSIDKPLDLPEKTTVSELEPAKESKSDASAAEQQSKADGPNVLTSQSTAARPKRKKWSDNETASLLKGVARFGIGSWTQILNCPDYKFDGRTALDLKDRFRVCCPDDYRTSRKSKNKSSSKAQPAPQTEVVDPLEKTNAPRSDRKSSLELRNLGIEAPFEKSKRRKRTAYSEAEDDAILKGFEKHGNSWTAIQQDDELGLKNRRPTDLRDRFRTKFPDIYEKAGLAPRPEVFPKKPDRTEKQDRKLPPRDDGEVVEQQSIDNPCSNSRTDPSRPEKENKESNPQALPRKHPPSSLLHNSDVFWGAPFDTEDHDNERITLDRKILDWPSDLARPAASADQTGKGSIESLATLELARHSGPMGTGPASTTQHTGSVAALPSLAAITAGSGSDDLIDQFELPSLVGSFGTLDGDTRTSGQFPSLEDLLS